MTSRASPRFWLVQRRTSLQDRYPGRWRFLMGYPNGGPNIDAGILSRFRRFTLSVLGHADEVAE